MRGSLKGSFVELPGEFLGQQFAMSKGTLAIGNIWNRNRYLLLCYRMREIYIYIHAFSPSVYTYIYIYIYTYI